MSYQKRYDPEKYYVYFVHIQREKQCEKTYLCRSFREFSEFHQKLCCLFPLVSHLLPSLSKGRNLGRSSVKVVAEKRRSELDHFLVVLFGMAEEICHCDLVYTFFHSLLRDQEEENNVNVAKWRNKSPSLAVRNNANASRYVQGSTDITIHLLFLFDYSLQSEYNNWLLNDFRSAEDIHPVHSRGIEHNDPTRSWLDWCWIVVDVIFSCRNDGWAAVTLRQDLLTSRQPQNHQTEDASHQEEYQSNVHGNARLSSPSAERSKSSFASNIFPFILRCLIFTINHFK